MKSNVDLYLNADKSKVVGEGDPDAAFLLVNAGREIPDAEVEKMGPGLLAQAQAFGQPAAPETKAVEPPENKAVEAAPENKGVEAPRRSAKE